MQSRYQRGVARLSEIDRARWSGILTGLQEHRAGFRPLPGGHSHSAISMGAPVSI